MKQIEKKMAKAVHDGKEMKIGNTRVYKLFGRWLYVSLHDNDIFCKDLQTGEISYSCAGWHTVTTRSRLNALGLNCGIRGGLIRNLDTGAVVPSRLS